MGRVSGELAVTETLSERLVRLPVFHDLTVEDQQRVIDEVLGFLADRRGTRSGESVAGGA